MDLGAQVIPSHFQEKNDISLGLAIADHFIRNSNFELAQEFCREAGIPLPQESVAQFSEMHKLVEEIRQCKLEGALE